VEWGGKPLLGQSAILLVYLLVCIMHCCLAVVPLYPVAETEEHLEQPSTDTYIPGTKRARKTQHNDVCLSHWL